MMRTFGYLLLCWIFIVSLCALSCAFAQTEIRKGKKTKMADLILTGGTVYTMDDKLPVAQGIAVSGNRIVAVGNEQSLLSLKGPETKIIPLGGKTAVPGLIDGHAHLLSLGKTLTQLNLVGTRSWEEVVEVVRKAVSGKRPGEWITGRGWDQNDWKVQAFPDHSRLTAVAPDNPVWLRRIAGHSGIANQRALDAAGITPKTSNPEGGAVFKNARTGKPTGILVDNAMSLVEKVIPPYSREENREALLRAIHTCLSLGITGMHDAGVDREGISLYKELAESGNFPFRVYGMLSGSSSRAPCFILEKPEVGLFNHKLTFRSIKLFIDGALGSRGAALLEDYSDDPGNRGLLTMSVEELDSISQKAVEHGFQVCTHAIGDRGVRLVLDAYEKALKIHPVPDARLRVEHAQIVSLDDIPRFAQLKVLPSMQPTHATSDMPWAEARVGKERTKGAYAWRKFLDSGLPIAAGSDFPVEHPNPLHGIYAAITRQDQEGNPSKGWYPAERMTREEALRAFTLDAAYFAFEEGLKGSLEKGKLADVVVLSKDIMKIPPREILETQVLLTIVDGKVVYRKE